MTPLPGWSVERAENDGGGVEIRLESADGEVRFEASLVRGVVRVSLESDDDSSGSGSGDDDDNSGPGGGARRRQQWARRRRSTMTETAGRRTPPAHVAKIASAGATGVFVLGLAAVMGYAEHLGGRPGRAAPTIAPAPIPTTLPAATTTSLAPTNDGDPAPATTIAPVPTPAPVAAAPPPVEIATQPPPPPRSGRHRVGAVAVSVPQAVRRFRAMGCRSTVIVEAGDVDVQRLAELAMIRIARLEAAWSTFLPDSDVSRLNRAAAPRSPCAPQP